MNRTGDIVILRRRTGSPTQKEGNIGGNMTTKSDLYVNTKVATQVNVEAKKTLLSSKSNLFRRKTNIKPDVCCFL